MHTEKMPRLWNLNLFHRPSRLIIINDQMLYRRDWADFRSQNLAGLLVFFFLSLSLEFRPQQVEDYYFELLSTNNEMVSPICRA